MLWIFTAAVAAGYVALLLFRDDASENIRKWIYPLLIALGFVGGLYFAEPSSNDEACASYGTRAGDC